MIPTPKPSSLLHCCFPHVVEETKGRLPVEQKKNPIYPPGGKNTC